jgi:hypothetical protein
MTEKSMYEQMAEHIGHGHSKYIPQIFEALASDDEAKLLLQARKPAVINDLARGIGLSEEVVEQMALNLFQKGLMYKSKKPKGSINLSIVRDETHIAN